MTVCWTKRRLDADERQQNASEASHNWALPRMRVNARLIACKPDELTVPIQCMQSLLFAARERQYKIDPHPPNVGVPPPPLHPPLCSVAHHFQQPCPAHLRSCRRP